MCITLYTLNLIILKKLLLQNVYYKLSILMQFLIPKNTDKLK